MDLEQLIKQRDELVAEAEKMLEGRPDKPRFERPIELQEAQAARVEARIASLEKAKAEFAKSVDLELKDLKADLEQRRTKIAVDRKGLGQGLPERATTPAAASRKAAKPASARKAAAAAKATKSVAKRPAPKAKGRGKG